MMDLIKSLVLALSISFCFGNGINEIQNNREQKLFLPAGADTVLKPILNTFSCVGKAYGYYADVDNECKVYHVCVPITNLTTGLPTALRYNFICPKYTVFDQKLLTCVRPPASVLCESSPSFYPGKEIKIGLFEVSDKETTPNEESFTTQDSSEISTVLEDASSPAPESGLTEADQEPTDNIILEEPDVNSISASVDYFIMYPTSTDKTIKDIFATPALVDGISETTSRIDYPDIFDPELLKDEILTVNDDVTSTISILPSKTDNTHTAFTTTTIDSNTPVLPYVHLHSSDHQSTHLPIFPDTSVPSSAEVTSSEDSSAPCTATTKITEPVTIFPLIYKEPRSLPIKRSTANTLKGHFFTDSVRMGDESEMITLPNQKIEETPSESSGIPQSLILHITENKDLEQFDYKEHKTSSIKDGLAINELITLENKLDPIVIEPSESDEEDSPQVPDDVISKEWSDSDEKTSTKNYVKIRHIPLAYMVSDMHFKQISKVSYPTYIIYPSHVQGAYVIAILDQDKKGMLFQE